LLAGQDAYAQRAAKPQSAMQRIQQEHRANRLQRFQPLRAAVEPISGTNGMVVWANLLESVAEEVRAKSTAPARTGDPVVDRFVDNAYAAKDLSMETIWQMRGIAQNLVRARTINDPPQRPTESHFIYKNVALTMAANGLGEPAHVVVTSTVKPFAKDFIRGASDPLRFFEEERQRIDGSANNVNLIKTWLATPVEHRVFVTGSRSDEKYVRILRELLANDDLRLFFYLDCAPECRSATVGSLFISAGTVLHVESAKSSSQFVPIEVRLIASLQHSSGRIETQEPKPIKQRQLLLFNPVSVFSGETNYRVIQARLIDCNQSEIRKRSAVCQKRK